MIVTKVLIIIIIIIIIIVFFFLRCWYGYMMSTFCSFIFSIVLYTHIYIVLVVLTSVLLVWYFCRRDDTLGVVDRRARTFA